MGWGADRITVCDESLYRSIKNKECNLRLSASGAEWINRAAGNLLTRPRILRTGDSATGAWNKSGMRTAPFMKRKIQGRKRGSGSCLFTMRSRRDLVFSNAEQKKRILCRAAYAEAPELSLPAGSAPEWRRDSGNDRGGDKNSCR